MNVDRSNSTRGATPLDPAARATVFQALRPALETLAREATADPQLSAEARRILRAVARTRAENTLALADLAARSSTPKTHVPAALSELECHGYLARLARIAPHLVTALPTPVAPGPDNLGSMDGDHHERPGKQTPPGQSNGPVHERSPAEMRAR